MYAVPADTAAAKELSIMKRNAGLPALAGCPREPERGGFNPRGGGNGPGGFRPARFRAGGREQTS
jgi:hypothetical protein